MLRFALLLFLWERMGGFTNSTFSHDILAERAILFLYKTKQTFALLILICFSLI